MVWTFFKYRSPNGADPIRRWQEEFPEVWEELRTNLLYLRNVDRKLWVRPAFDVLSGKHRKICEHRIKAGKIEHRPLGCFYPERGSYTFLVGAQKKMVVYVPKGAKDTAERRRRELESGDAEVEELSIEES